MVTNNPSDMLDLSSGLLASDSASTNTALRRNPRAFWGAFCIAVLTCLSPFNALGYAAPMLVMGWYILFRRKKTTFLNCCIWLMGWVAVICFYIPFSPGFAIQSAFLAIITYSAFVVPFAIRGRDIVDQRLWSKVLNLLWWVVLLEGIFGIIQAVYGSAKTGSFAGVNGDYVQGTLYPHLAPEMALSNPMYAINMVFMLLALTPMVVLKRKYWLAFAVGSVAFLLANVFHVIYLLAVALLISFILYYPTLLKTKVGILLAVICVLIGIISVTVTGFQGSLAQALFSRNLEGESPRGIVLRNVVEKMPQEYPLMPLIGIGPGQFTSRAGLIGTGLYFGTPEKPHSVPFLSPTMSPAFRKYVLYAWRYFPFPRYLASSTTQPFFSWQSVYVEFGGIVSLLLALFVASWLWKLRRYARTTSLRVQAVALGTGILLLFLLGIQENYWVVPQAILIGLLLFKMEFANLRADYEQFVIMHRRGG
jgi:hypothetical protein